MNLRKASLIAATILIVIATVLLPVVSAATVSFNPVGDAAVNNTVPTTNYGSYSVLSVRDERLSDEPVSITMSFIYFDLSSIPPGSTITSAYLRLHIQAYDGVQWSGTANVNVGRVTGSWSESTITWGNMPEYVSTGIAITATDSDEGTFVSFDLTSEVQAIVNGADNYGWNLYADPSTVGNADSFTFVGFESKDHSDSTLRPKLDLTFTSSATVIPEYAYGALIALATFFAALIAFKKLPKIIRPSIQ